MGKESDSRKQKPPDREAGRIRAHLERIKALVRASSNPRLHLGFREMGRAVSEKLGDITFKFSHFPCGCEYYLKAGQMMLEELGEKKAASMIMKAIKKVLKEGKVRTKDLGGTSATSEVGDAIAESILKM